VLRRPRAIPGGWRMGGGPKAVSVATVILPFRQPLSCDRVGASDSDPSAATCKQRRQAHGRATGSTDRRRRSSRASLPSRPPFARFVHAVPAPRNRGPPPAARAGARTGVGPSEAVRRPHAGARPDAATPAPRPRELWGQAGKCHMAREGSAGQLIPRRRTARTVGPAWPSGPVDDRRRRTPGGWGGRVVGAHRLAPPSHRLQERGRRESPRTSVHAMVRRQHGRARASLGRSRLAPPCLVASGRIPAPRPRPRLHDPISSRGPSHLMLGDCMKERSAVLPAAGRRRGCNPAFRPPAPAPAPAPVPAAPGPRPPEPSPWGMGLEGAPPRAIWWKARRAAGEIAAGAIGRRSRGWRAGKPSCRGCVPERAGCLRPRALS
jgi:hypothetical protein